MAQAIDQKVVGLMSADKNALRKIQIILQKFYAWEVLAVARLKSMIIQTNCLPQVEHIQRQFIRHGR